LNWTSLVFETVDRRIARYRTASWWSGRSSISLHTVAVRMDYACNRFTWKEKGIVPCWKLRSLIKRSVSPIRVRHVVRPPLPLATISCIHTPSFLI